MASLIGTYVTSNYLKAAPSTQFGTRQLAFVKVVATGSDGSTAVNFSTNYTDSNSDFAKAVRTVQISNEIFAVGTPNGTGFVVAIADDTRNGSEPDSHDQAATYGQLEAALVAALAKGGSATATVTPLSLTGVGLA